MKGLSTTEMETAMVEIGNGKTSKTTSLKLDTPERKSAFTKLEYEMRAISSKGKVHIPAEW